MQTPSVTTPIGSEGMHDDDLWPGFVTDKLTAYVTAAVNLYNDEKKWLEAQSYAKKLLHSRYDSLKLGKKLLSKIKETEISLAEHRLNNFTGSMLKHHSMMSTKYMSQWISEKNKHKNND